MAYFDNAATTYPKPECVYSYMDEFYRHNGGNAGRGNYGLAQTAGKLISDTRNRIQELLHCQAKQIVFEPSATISINIVIQGLIKSGIKNVYISPFEHNAVTRTLYNYSKDNFITINTLAVGNNLVYDVEKMRYQFDDKKPDLVIVSHASNVIGLVAPIEEIFSLAKRYGAYTLLDMAQTAGLVDCKVGADIIDFAVFAGHKTLLGPTGISGFIMKPEIDLQPVIFGGTGFESANQNMPKRLPERFEMGTLNIAGMAGLYASLGWIQKHTINELYSIEIKKRNRLIELLRQYEFVKLIGVHEKCKYVGIVSCLIEGISSDSAGIIFNEQGIAIRTGLQCAPYAHQFLGTFPTGTIRFSVNCFTKDEDFDELKQVLDYIEENI
ncbi:aminotransferase class V-fold PLP-dependent enzyme [Eshraghiella crossota]|nr:cysteine desulfurase [Butyrivibrio sp.]